MSMNAAIEGCLSDLRRMATDSDGVQFQALVRFLKGDRAVFDDLAKVAQVDETKPYGRRVLLETDELEVMVASWTRGIPCAPHDHGGSAGAVRVLAGRARHQVWGIDNGTLRVVREETVEPGGVMACGPALIHSMGDDGASDPLVTLHMYTKSVDHMVVYDRGTDQTLVVEGSCGAWVPTDRPEMIRHAFAGVLEPSSVR